MLNNNTVCVNIAGRHVVSLKTKNLDGAMKKGANMSDEIRFADSWFDGVYVVAPSSEEYMQIKQNYDRSSSGCHRTYIIGLVSQIAKASEPILISVC